MVGGRAVVPEVQVPVLTLVFAFNASVSADLMEKQRAQDSKYATDTGERSANIYWGKERCFYQLLC